jgi:hypothetical protein
MINEKNTFGGFLLRCKMTSDVIFDGANPWMCSSVGWMAVVVTSYL